MLESLLCLILIHLIHLLLLSLLTQTDSTYTVGRSIRNLRGRLSSSARALGSFYYLHTCILYKFKFEKNLAYFILGSLVGWPLATGYQLYDLVVAGYVIWYTIVWFVLLPILCYAFALSTFVPMFID